MLKLYKPYKGLQQPAALSSSLFKGIFIFLYFPNEIIMKQRPFLSAEHDELFNILIAFFFVFFFNSNLPSKAVNAFNI